MSRYTRGKKVDRAAVMESLIKNANISPEGADWLTLRLDPYHDFNRPIAGYPDADTYNTIVSVNNYEYNVTKPAAAAGLWDAHIFTMPWDSTTFYLGNMVNGLFTQTAANYHVGLVNIAKDDAGAPLFPTAVPVASANFSMDYIDAFDNFQNGHSRIIGMGLEVVDTSSPLVKQGALTAYKMPSTSASTDYGFLNAAGTGQFQICNALVTQRPPSSVAEAVIFRDSVQWEAKDGAYMAVGQEGINNPFTVVGRQPIIITPDSTITGTDVTLANAPSGVTALQAPPLLTACYMNSNQKRANVTQSGIILTGLHNDATFKIRVRLYVERAPQRGETELIPLASPSAAYDYKALAMYSVLVHQLPIAVPVGFNAKGDWWRMVIDLVRRYAPLVGGMLAPFVGPTAGLVGNTVGEIAGTIQKATQAKKKRVASKSAPPKK